jgi:hypothetical protein
VDTIAAEVDGKFMSAFVRAVKKARSSQHSALIQKTGGSLMTSGWLDAEC